MPNPEAIYRFEAEDYQISTAPIDHELSEKHITSIATMRAQAYAAQLHIALPREPKPDEFDDIRRNPPQIAASVLKASEPRNRLIEGLAWHRETVDQFNGNKILEVHAIGRPSNEDQYRGRAVIWALFCDALERAREEYSVRRIEAPYVPDGYVYDLKETLGFRPWYSIPISDSPQKPQKPSYQDHIEYRNHRIPTTALYYE